MSEKDTISIQLVREALLQSCAPGIATEEVLNKVGIDPVAATASTAGCRPRVRAAVAFTGATWGR
jgi:hypothetical protein